MDIPYSELQGTITEVHGPPGSGKRKELVRYVRKMQDTQDKLVLYVDLGSRLHIENPALDMKKTWFLFHLGTVKEDAFFFRMVRRFDIVILDDFTLLRRNLWKFLRDLKNTAKESQTVVFLLNQERYVLDYRAGDYHLQPYHQNIIENYCSRSYDVFTGRWKTWEEPDSRYDSFSDMLMHFGDKKGNL